MKNTIKNTLYAGFGATTAGMYTVSSAINAGEDKLNKDLTPGDKTFDQYIQSMVNWVLTFLSIIGVLILIYAGFQILTAAGDEEKVKKGKTMVIQALIGLVVIFAAWSIVSLILTGLATSAQ